MTRMEFRIRVEDVRYADGRQVGRGTVEAAYAHQTNAVPLPAFEGSSGTCLRGAKGGKGEGEPGDFAVGGIFFFLQV